MAKNLSFIIPFYNEEQSLKLLYENIISAIKENSIQNYQIIFINDGSKDNSKNIVNKIIQNDKNVTLIDFKKNKGKSKALQAGFLKAEFDIVAVLDADLQNNPKEINKFLEKIENGFDFVCGYRKNRKDYTEKKLRSYLFNTIFRLITGISLHDCNCGFKVFKKEVAKKLANLDLIHSYIVFQAFKCGFKNITEVEISHQKRLYGKSKYGLKRYFTGFYDIVKILYRDKI